MKKILILLLCLLLTASITGCGTQSIKPIDTIEGNMKTYSEMSDGTWQCDGHIYKYRLEISGRLSNAVKDSTYIYLSNIEDITFEQAWNWGEPVVSCHCKYGKQLQNGRMPKEQQAVG